VKSFEHSNENYGSINGGEYLDQLSDCELLKNDLLRGIG
jgi:hypothetical protein